MKNVNLLMNSDSYKYGHWNMFPKNTTKTYLYCEARKNAQFDKTVMFSLQYLIKEYLSGKVVTQEKIDKTKALIDIHLGPGIFNKEGWQYILDECEGKLPIEIKAVAEGSVVDKGNVLFTIENLDKKCFWLPGFLETVLMTTWLGCSVATLTRETMLIINKFLDQTSNNPDVAAFMFHNFGARSSAGVEAAAITGAAHSIISNGTDTVAGIELLMNYYKAKVSAFSVPATEHGIMCLKGKEGEFEIVENLLDKYPTGILSIVIDTFDWENFVKVMGTTYKKRILARNGVLVFRPDSGNPVNTTLAIVKTLDKYFGSTTNDLGYKVLNNKVRVLWGDGINMKGIWNILNTLATFKYSAENIVFGQGGALTHSSVSRDMQSFAIKSSYVVIDGIGRAVFKDPKDGAKKSKKGRLALVYKDGKYKTLENIGSKVEKDLLIPIFRNGELLKEYTLDEVKKNICKF